MHHIGNKGDSQSMNDDVKSLALHENSLFTAYRRETALLHPSRNSNMLPSRGLVCAIHVLQVEK